MEKWRERERETRPGFNLQSLRVSISQRFILLNPPPPLLVQGFTREKNIKWGLAVPDLGFVSGPLASNLTFITILLIHQVATLY